MECICSSLCRCLFALRRRRLDSVSADADAGNDVKTLRVVLGLAYASLALADGSAVMLKQRVGPFDVTLFGDSAHLTTAQTNLSLMVQKASDHSDVPDAKVTLRFTRNENGKTIEVVAPATHAKASNKTLYGAVVTRPN